MADDHLLQLQPGTVVNDRYEIVKCLGAGSMGMVYACRHRELSGHLVAMKVLFGEMAKDPTAAARFRNEIVASYGVNHPNVVRAYEYFRDGDIIAFTMEYVAGGDLADRISMDDRMPVKEVVRMLLQMASGLQAIHQTGIIHRDMKPENILLTAQGDVKITDFGIARMNSGPRLTEHGGVVGTIDYVSPEYLEKGQVDLRSDIYALGVMAYEMITGETPFKGKSVIETMTMRLKTDPTVPHILRADCPEGLSDIIMKCLARTPETRYQTASEIHQDLLTLQSGGLAVTVQSQVAVGGGGGAPEGDRSPTLPLHNTVKKSQIRPVDAKKGLGAVKPLEPMLKNRGHLNTVSPDDPAASISVSRGHLSAERIRVLSSEVQQEDRSLKSALIALFVVLLGFAGALFFLQQLIDVDSKKSEPLGVSQPL
jgi:serine/threonine protein kinase